MDTRASTFLRRVLTLLLTALLAVTLTLQADTRPAADQEITVGIVANNEPYSSIQGETPRGLSLDVLNRISDDTGLRFRYQVGSWSDIYAAFLRGELDVIDEISWREDRAKTILFTDPYHIRTTAVMQHQGRPLSPITKAKDLRPYRVGVLKDIYYRDFLVEQGLEVTEYSLQSHMVQALAYGWVDAVVGPEVTLNYLARQQGFFQMETHSVIPLDGMETEDFRLGVLKDRPLLHQRLQSAVQSLSREWLNQQVQRWVEFDGRRPIQSPQLNLSPAQQAYIRSLPPLRVGMMRDYAPFSFSEGGQIRGLSADVLYRLQDMTGIRMTPVADHWSQLFRLFQQGDLDLIADISDLPERRAFTLFTQPYYRIPNVAFTRNPTLQLNKPSDLNGLKIAIGHDVFYARTMKKLFAGNVITYTEQASMFKALDSGRVDVVITSLMNGNHWIREQGLTGLRVAGELKLPGMSGEDLRLGLRPELAPLQQILDQALRQISHTEKRIIENRWLGVQTMPRQRSVQLNEQEAAYLRSKNNRLSYCIHPRHHPLESLNPDKHHTGMSSDLIRALREQLPVSFSLQITDSWHDTLQALQQGECDFAPMTEPRSQLPGLSFSKSWHNAPNVILGRLNAPFIEQLSELEFQPLGIEANSPLIPQLQQRYPNLQLIPVKNSLQGIQQVRRGQLYAFIGTLAHSRYLLQKEGLADIRVLGRLPIDNNYAIAMQNQPQLTGIMNKLLNSLDRSEFNRIENNWHALQPEKKPDYTLIWQIAGAFVAVFLLLFYWNRKLGSLNNQLQKANARLAQLSQTDQLTGLGNRNYMEQSLQQLSTQPADSLIGVALIDADHFKAINDRHGHKTGDLCLQVLGRCMQQHFNQPQDYLIRFGGEEFLIFSITESEQALNDRLEHLRWAISQETIGQDLHFTISIGVSFCPLKTFCLQHEQRIARADAALYEAKTRGRNRLISDQQRCVSEENTETSPL